MAITILDTEDPLKIKELQTFYRRAKLVLHPAWSHLLLGFLVWVQDKYLEQKIVATVDQAVKEWEQVSPPPAYIPPPVYSETGTGFFSEIRLTAPWALPTSSPSGSSPSSSSASSPGPGSTSSSPSSSS